RVGIGEAVIECQADEFSRHCRLLQPVQESAHRQKAITLATERLDDAPELFRSDGNRLRCEGPAVARQDAMKGKYPALPGMAPCHQRRQTAGPCRPECIPE